MKTFSLMAVVLGLGACTVNVTGGTGTTSTTSQSTSTTSSTTSQSTTSVPCTDCLTQSVTWGPNGGLVQYTTESSLAACRTFTYTQTPAGGPPTGTDVKSCSVEITGCDASPSAVHDVEQALAHPDVATAFAGSTSLYGTDPRPYDGTVLSITLGSKTILVGGDCGDGSGLPGSTCVPVPAGVRALATVLVDVEQASLKVGECEKTFP